MSALHVGPLRFEPIMKERAWGGDALAEFGKQIPVRNPPAPIGESWDLADLPPPIVEGRSVVAEGPCAGTTLHDLLEREETAILGRVGLAATGGFPLLVKFLDAEDNLSLQVHPDDAYCRQHPGAFSKTEAWFVLSAREGAMIYRGVEHDVDPERFRAAIQDGSALALMTAIPVKPGDCIGLPSGICHAIGAGVVAAELQTPSDTTFRVWDWNRNDPNRPLHVEPALETMRFGTRQDDAGAGVQSLSDAPAVTVGGATTRPICSMREFRIEHITLSGDSITVRGDDAPVVLLAVEGTATVHAEHGEARFNKGDVVLVPACCEATIEPAEPIAFLRTDLPVLRGTLLA